MPLDRAWAEEQPRSDLGVRQPVTREPRDLPLLRSEIVARLRPAPTHARAGGQQLAPCALGEPLDPHLGEHSVRRAQLLTRIHASTLAAQPLAVEQMRSPEVDAQPRATQVVDRLPVEALGLVALAHQGARACLDAKPEAGAGGPCCLREALD